jgi:multidrug transporter EmrE-like cation transporter
MAIIIAIAYNFKLARQAGLNIGIAQAIWSINPFFQAMFDLFLYRSKIYPFHWIGMTLFVICGVIVSLSNLVYD